MDKLMIVGNLGRDPEMRYTPDGTPVTDFSVAANRRWKNKNGDRVEKTVWYRCTAWRRQAEVCNQYLKKGRQVLIEGELNPDDDGNPRIWTGNDGTSRASFEVTIRSIQFLGGNGGGQGGNAPAPQAPPEEEVIPF